MHHLQLAPSTSLLGPRLGLDRQQVYVFWTQISHSGSGADSAATFYLRFPPFQLARVSPASQLFVPTEHNLPYSSLSGGFLAADERVPWDAWRVPEITDVGINAIQESELMVTFRSRISYLRNKVQGQVGTAFFQGGDPTGYQLLSFTPADSTDPAIVSDAAGRIYITWLEKSTSRAFSVFCASTAPDVQDALRPLTWLDVGRLSADTLFGLLGGALLIPLAMAWMVPAATIAGLTSAIRNQDAGLTRPRTLISLGLSLTAYWVSKLAILPAVFDYVPFSAWLPLIPPWLNDPLRWGVPLLLTGLGLALAWNYTYRRANPSMFLFVLITTAIDGVLSVAVYGVLFFGAF